MTVTIAWCDGTPTNDLDITAIDPDDSDYQPSKGYDDPTLMNFPMMLFPMV
jgi:hypothetical protein